MRHSLFSAAVIVDVGAVWGVLIPATAAPLVGLVPAPDSRHCQICIVFAFFSVPPSQRICIWRA